LSGTSPAAVQVRNEARLADRRVKGHHRILVIRPVLAMIRSVRSNVQAGGRRPAASPNANHRNQGTAAHLDGR
jgi:hypothetical protein